MKNKKQRGKEVKFSVKARARDLVNFGLLLSLVVMAMTGTIAFWLPFSLVNTRIHILSGVASLVFLAVHLLHRKQYLLLSFTSQWTRLRKQMVGACLLIGTIVIAAIYPLGPVNDFFQTSYEASHAREIVRRHPQSGVSILPNLIKAVRKTDIGAHQLNLELHLVDDKPEDLAIAVWLSSTSGSLIETLYISTELAFSDEVRWHEEDFLRAEILPIWRHRYTLVSGLSPDGNVDASTGATDNHSFSLDNYLLPEGDEFVVNIEINRAMDTTPYWNNEILGQPSMLYTAYVQVPENGRQYHLLELTGHGGIPNDLGKIQYGMDDIDTSNLPIEFGIISIGD